MSAVRPISILKNQIVAWVALDDSPPLGEPFELIIDDGSIVTFTPIGGRVDGDSIFFYGPEEESSDV